MPLSSLLGFVSPFKQAQFLYDLLQFLYCGGFPLRLSLAVFQRKKDQCASTSLEARLKLAMQYLASLSIGLQPGVRK
jgi:hypothetical protein